jgi:hypothetical protein
MYLQSTIAKISPPSIIYLNLPPSSFSDEAPSPGGLLAPFEPPHHQSSKRQAPDNARVIASHQNCFSTYEECMTETSDCSDSRGECVEGIKRTLTGAEQCYVCACGSTTKGEGKSVKTTYWAGETCEKEDISK